MRRTMTQRGRRLALVIVLGTIGAVGAHVAPPLAHAAGGNTWYVDPNASDPVTCPAPNPVVYFQTIAKALECSANDAAPADNPDYIVLYPSMAGTPPYAGGFIINQNVVIVGHGATENTISNSGSGITVGSGYTVTISGVTITDGNGSSACSGTCTAGGGIYTSGTLTLPGVTLNANAATFGGATYNNYGTLTLTNCTVAANTGTGNGGGIDELTLDIVPVLLATHIRYRRVR